MPIVLFQVIDAATLAVKHTLKGPTAAVLSVAASQKLMAATCEDVRTHIYSAPGWEGCSRLVNILALLIPLLL